MIEIVLLVFLSIKIGRIVDAKGHSRTRHIIHFVCLWVLGQLLGLTLGTMIVEGNWAYLFAIAGGIIFAVMAFIVANNLPDLTETEETGLDEWP